MIWDRITIYSPNGRPKVRRAKHSTNWLVEYEHFARKPAGGFGVQLVTITCRTHTDAIHVARTIADGRGVDMDRVVALMRGWWK